MSTSVCEVIGCSMPAAWKLVVELDSYCERYLCDAHWHVLHSRVPDHSDSYLSLEPSLSPSEGQDSRPAMQSAENNRAVPSNGMPGCAVVHKHSHRKTPVG